MKDILAKFPSLAFVAREIGANYKAVTKWSERDSIPADRDLEIVDLARREGIDLTLEQIAKARHAAAESRREATVQ